MIRLIAIGMNRPIHILTDFVEEIDVQDEIMANAGTFSDYIPLN